LQALYNKYKEDDFIVVAISLDRSDMETVKKFVDDMGLTFPTLHDPTTGIGSEYGVRGVPSTYIVNHQGEVIGGVVGPRQWDAEEADQLVQYLLEDMVTE
jgi:peroxiredoxin